MFLLAVAIGAFASRLTGIADRWGCANIVAYGLVTTGLVYNSD